MHFWLLACFYMLGAPGIALAVGVACRRYQVILWMGGILTTVLGALMLYFMLSLFSGPPGDWEMGCKYVMLMILPFLVAGLVLLVGGLVRWGLACRRRGVSLRLAGALAIASGASALGGWNYCRQYPEKSDIPALVLAMSTVTLPLIVASIGLLVAGLRQRGDLAAKSGLGQGSMTSEPTDGEGSESLHD